MEDYRKYYQLEDYLINYVGKNFRETGLISEQDFYLIITWKSNRSKSITYKRLTELSPIDHVNKIACSIYLSSSEKEKMKILIKEWRFSLPLASAILTILYPDKFTIYDVRVRNALGIKIEIKSTVFEKIWAEYQSYIELVKDSTPSSLSLRDKDKYLWGKSLITDLRNDLKMGFPAKK